jgi:Chaperone of endosialidase
VVLAECDGSDHQVWELDTFPSNASLFAIVDPAGLCVTVDGPTAAPGTPLVLAQCAEMQNQGWIQGGAARPIPVRSQGGTYVGGYGEYAEPEYYWYTGHRYCWYDGGWHGPGWYWCGENFHDGFGWGGPIGWHFWYHFGHKWLNHPVFFAAHLGQPPHNHDVIAIQKGKGNLGGQGGIGNQGGQGGKGNQAGQGGKGNQGAQGGQGAGQGSGGKGGKGGKGEKGNKGSQGAQGGQGGAGSSGAGGGQGSKGKEKIIRGSSGSKGGSGGGGGGGNKGGGAGPGVSSKIISGGGGGGNKGGGGGGGGANKGGSSGGGAKEKEKRPSDIRLKQDIVPLARLESGIELYRFRYKGGDPTTYVGVMAQEVQTIMPSAVSLGRNRYLQVDYDRLGLKFMTWDTWVQRHGAEFSPAN